METMDELANTQQQLGSEIQRIITNYKKDSEDRKTKEYLIKRIHQLKELKEAFELNDDKIREISDPPLNHEYFTKEYYEKTSNKADTYISELEKKAAKYEVPDEITISKLPQSLSNSSAIIRKLNVLINIMNNRCRHIMNDNMEYSKETYPEKIKRLEQEWLILHTANLEVWEKHENPQIFGYNEEKYMDIEVKLNSALTTLLARANKSSDSHGPSNCAVAQSIQLPKITIPKFNGDYMKWQQFNDLFTEMIDKQQIPDAQKMWYLTSSLVGEAANLINHLAITNSNYSTAWQLIKERYENKRAIVSALVQSILEQPGVGHKATASASEIQTLADKTREALSALKNIGIDTQTWGPILIHILLKKLDNQSRMLYEQSLTNPRMVPEVNELLKFLELRFQSLEVVGPRPKQAVNKSLISTAKHPEKSLTTTINRAGSKVCQLCKKAEHSLFKCDMFLNKSISDRQNIVKNLKACFNCLRTGHMSNNCNSRSCTKCEKKHNTLLHQEAVPHSATITTNSQHLHPNSLFSTSSTKNSYVLLGTAVINIISDSGLQLKCRAMLDSGSQVNLITQKLVNQLNLETKPLKILVEGIGQGKKAINSSVRINVKSRTTNFSTMVNALVLPQITSKQPQQRFNIRDWKIPPTVKLADPEFYCPDKVDILLGAEIFYELLTDGLIKLADNLPFFKNTVFGWICVGKLTEAQQNTPICGIFSESEEDLNRTLTKFWQLDEVSPTKNNLNEAEQKCEAMFAQDTERDKNGRFIVKIPFKEDPICLGSSFQQATNRFLSLEQRLAKNPDIKHQYIQFMRDYERLGHMQKVNQREFEQSSYFIPHHCVIKPDSSTTKLRVVFDASANTTNGLSLNDIMFNGPVVQNELSSILMRFRMHRFVFTTDIEKMYRQILMHESHQQYQLIVWRENPNDKMEIFKLKTVTYGTRSAPYLATKCLQSLAKDNAIEYPFGAKALERDFYVDDGLTGADTLSETIIIKQELCKILATAGFKLRKWCANNAQLLEDTPQEDKEIDLDFDNTQTKATIKTLGILWLPKTDQLRIKTTTEYNAMMTKRTLTSELARIYDPLGLVAPVTVKAKILIQSLWQLKLDWDQILPIEFQQKWSKFREDLQNLNSVQIARHITNHKQANNMQLHVFMDASQKAYGAAVYLRSITKDRAITVQLLCAKTRVAPLKTQTIPRLELCAALLGAELVTRVRIDLDMQGTPTFMWSDSEIVLYWINSESSRYQTFVAHRIGKIQELTSMNQWRHVSSKHNSADLLSRGVSAREISKCSLWFHGPLFLHGHESQWPAVFNQNLVAYQPTEERRIKTILSISTKESFVNMIYCINHRNSWTCLQNTVGYILRFIEIIQTKQKKCSQVLSPAEINKSVKVIVKAIQESEFSDEIKLLSSSSINLSASNSLASLSPFLDSDGLIRVGGRLQEANLPFDSKHPILLPYNDSIVKLLMRHLHESNLHCGPQALLSITRQQFWPIKGKLMARSILKHCVRCSRMQPKFYSQVMGNLPQDRVQLQRPFLNSGVDFCGPIWIHYKLRGKRPCKAYVSVFCCFATKAVHLEIVSDLTTDAFLGALNRFISRRGRCQRLYCDNATNFVGANNHLKELQEIIHNDHSHTKISKYCSQKGIEFKFIPPRAPHFGGLWEAAVKSSKHLLVKEIGHASLTYEELETVVVQIEGILNSRPLTPMSSNPNDLSALTPGHFLIGEALNAYPDPKISREKTSLLKRWRLVNHLKEEFWKRWSVEYLNELQNRSKWKVNTTNIECGTMVILREDNLPPLQWPLGRIVKTYEGNDGMVRVVDVKTSSGTIRRPIHRLAPLFPEEGQINAPDKIDEKFDDQNHRSKRPRLNIPNTASIIITILLCLPLILCNSVNVTEFPKQLGIYFDEIGKTYMSSTDWNLWIYYDLQPIKEDILTLNKGNLLLQQICTQSLQQKTCKGFITQFTEAEAEFEMENKLFQTKRSKRGAIDVVGNLAHSLFGVLDSEYAEQMSETIRKVNENENYELELIKNQTTIIDSTANVIKSNQKEIKNKFDIIDQVLVEVSNHLNRAEKTTAENKAQQALLLLITQLTLLVGKIQRTQTMIINALTDAHHGQIGPLLLSPDQLKKEVSRIRGHLSSSVQFPVAQDELLTIYKLMTVKAGLTNNHALFKINIPLIGTYEFNSYTVIPIPALVNGTLISIKPSFEILAITSHGDAYYPMTVAQRNKCTQLTDRNYICSLTQSVYHKGSNFGSCELNFFNNETYRQCDIVNLPTDLWTQLSRKNMWLYAVKTPKRLTAVCGNTITKIDIKESGLLNINAECVIKNEAVTLHGQQNVTSVMSLSFPTHATLAQFIDIKSLKPINISTVIQPVNLDFKELSLLQDRIKHEQIFELPKNIEKTNYHAFGIIYTMLTIIIITALYKLIIWYKNKKNAEGVTEQPKPLPRSQGNNFTIDV